MEYQELNRRYEQVVTARAPYETEWREIASYVYPFALRYFSNAKTTKGDDDRRQIFDQTAERAVEDFAADLVASTVSVGGRWVNIIPENPKNLEVKTVKDWCTTASRKAEKYLLRPECRFHMAYDEAVLEGTWSGNGPIFRRQIGKQYVYESVPIAQCFFEENYFGQIDTVYRRYMMAARQILQEFIDTDMPSFDVSREYLDYIKEKAECEPNFEFEIVHLVYPNDKGTDKSLVASNYKFSSVHFLKAPTDGSKREGPAVLRRSGYKKFPYYTIRMRKKAGEVYGRGAGHRAVKDSKTLQKMEKTNLEAGELTVKPPIQMPYKGFVDNRLDLGPHALNFYRSIGGSGAKGSDKAEPIYVVGSLPIGLEMTDRKREQIKQAFYLDKIAEDKNAEMSATESSIRQSERQTSRVPQLTRLTTECLSRVVEDLIDHLEDIGELEPRPEELKKDGISFIYMSAIARMQGNLELQNLRAFIADMQGLAGIYPEAKFAFKAEEAPQYMADRGNVDSTLVRDKEEVQQMAKDERDGQMAAQTGASLADTAKAQLDLARAGAL